MKCFLFFFYCFFSLDRRLDNAGVQPADEAAESEADAGRRESRAPVRRRGLLRVVRLGTGRADGRAGRGPGRDDRVPGDDVDDRLADVQGELRDGDERDHDDGHDVHVRPVDDPDAGGHASHHRPADRAPLPDPAVRRPAAGHAAQAPPDAVQLRRPVEPLQDRGEGGARAQEGARRYSTIFLFPYRRS